MTKRATDDQIVGFVRDFPSKAPVWAEDRVRGRGPTVQEVADALGYKWTVQVRARLRKLELSGRLFRKKRAGENTTWYPVGVVLEGKR